MPGFLNQSAMIPFMEASQDEAFITPFRLAQRRFLMYFQSFPFS